jgi:hypothetical protein
MEAFAADVARLVARTDELVRRLDGLEKHHPAVLTEQLGNLKADVLELREEVTGLKRSLYTLAVSISSGAALFAFTAFQLWGRGGG